MVQVKTKRSFGFKKNERSELKMRKRKKLSMRKSKKIFRKTASRTHKKNVRTGPMRGGIRL